MHPLGGKYIDLAIRQYKTKCCDDGFYYIVGKEDLIKCVKCDLDVSSEIKNEWERLNAEFEAKLLGYQLND